MRLELVSIETDTDPLDGIFYEPAGGARNGAVLIMHGNCGNFYTGLARTLPAHFAAQGLAVLAFNRRGHDIVTGAAPRPGGAAFQRIGEMIEDNRLAHEFLARRGHRAVLVAGHSHGGMLAVRHAAGNADVRGLVLFSAHMGGRHLFGTISRAGMMAGDRLDHVSARARELVAEGRGRELLRVPGWWWVISAEVFVDHLDICPDIIDLAPQVTCPVLFLRGDREPRHLYPGEEFVARAGGAAEFALVEDCDHVYAGREAAAFDRIAAWMARAGLVGSAQS